MDFGSCHKKKSVFLRPDRPGRVLQAIKLFVNWCLRRDANRQCLRPACVPRREVCVPGSGWPRSARRFATAGAEVTERIEDG